MFSMGLPEMAIPIQGTGRQRRKIIKNTELLDKDVAKVEIYEVQTPTIDVSVSPSVMAQSRITTSDIVHCIRSTEQG